MAGRTKSPRLSRNVRASTRVQTTAVNAQSRLNALRARQRREEREALLHAASTKAVPRVIGNPLVSGSPDPASGAPGEDDSNSNKNPEIKAETASVPPDHSVPTPNHISHNVNVPGEQVGGSSGHAQAPAGFPDFSGAHGQGQPNVAFAGVPSTQAPRSNSGHTAPVSPLISVRMPSTAPPA